MLLMRWNIHMKSGSVLSKKGIESRKPVQVVVVTIYYRCKKFGFDNGENGLCLAVRWGTSDIYL